MLKPSTWPPNLTEEQGRDLFMLTLEDDTEESPWMTMGDLQFWSASSLAHSLRIYAHEHHLPWYVASMMPIRYRWKTARKRQLAPDIFVAFVPEHARSSFDVDLEGRFPPFVLEVVSPSSVERDEEEKREAYENLKVIEYALFTPRDGEPSSLQGYRLNAANKFDSWQPDASGRLWSDLLGLFLVPRGNILLAQTGEGELLRTPEEEAEARREAESEAERLRQELKRYRNP